MDFGMFGISPTNFHLYSDISKIRYIWKQRLIMTSMSENN